MKRCCRCYYSFHNIYIVVVVVVGGSGGGDGDGVVAVVVRLPFPLLKNAYLNMAYSFLWH